MRQTIQQAGKSSEFNWVLMRMNILMSFWQKCQKLCSFYLVYILPHLNHHNHFYFYKYLLNMK